MFKKVGTGTHQVSLEKPELDNNGYDHITKSHAQSI
jgi:hypothetical protein